MAFFNRFFGSVVSKKKRDDEVDDDLIWRHHNSEMPENCSVRCILFRECDRKGKKLLFDSSTVVKIKSDPSGKDGFTEITDGWGYKYLQPPAKDARMLYEMIFGGAAVTHPCPNMKLHNLDSNSLMWSSVIQAPHPVRGVKASDQSLGSSFGCSFGSFNVHDSNGDLYGVSPMYSQSVIQHPQGLAASDSGFYSTYSPGSIQNSFNSFATVESDSDLGVPGTARPQSGRRRLSSNADMPDYGSWCSLQRRYMSMIENTLSPPEINSHSQPNIPHMGSKPCQINQSDSLSLRETRRSNALLGVAIIITTPDESSQKIFLKQNLVVEDIFSQLFLSVKQAYIHKRKFVSTIYAGFEECQRSILKLYTLSFVQSSAWHMILGNNLSNSVSLQDKLVQDIVWLREELDTKETNFYLSSLLTGILSHHLGWVETVMPSYEGCGDNSLNKPGSAAVEQFSQLHWYSPTKMQYKEMHGMVGCPARNVKTLILCEEESLARRLVFVLSYFIRCSQVFERDLKVMDSEPYQSVKYKVYKENQTKQVNGLEDSNTIKIVQMGKSNSSPTLEPKLGKQSAMKKSKSFITSLSDLNTQESEISSPAACERVNFLIGENENLNIYHESAEECTDDTNFDHLDSGLMANMNSLNLDDEDIVVTRGVPIAMEKADNNTGEYIDVTEIPAIPIETVSTAPASLPSLICCSDQYMPGTLIQGCYNMADDSWRASLQNDLLATAGNHLVAGCTDECISVVGDTNKLEVSLVSAQQIVVGRPGLPVPMSPMVANILDSFTSTASFSLPANVVLNQLEDNLQQLYLQSCILAEYLLSAEDFLNLQTISDILDVDPCDVPLLLSIAATHTPSVGQKYGLSFSA